MPGMNMNQMAMSSGMFNGYGPVGMGMGGMNMGGFDGSFNNWNGQMQGNFGANAGYYPSDGYNQQSHPQGQYSHQMRSRNNFQSQNHAYGAGSYQQRNFNRGGYRGNFRGNAQFQGRNQMHNDPFAGPVSHQEQGEDEAFSHQLPDAMQDRRTSLQEPVEPDDAQDADIPENTEEKSDHADGKELANATSENVSNGPKNPAGAIPSVGENEQMQNGAVQNSNTGMSEVMKQVPDSASGGNQASYAAGSDDASMYPQAGGSMSSYPQMPFNQQGNMQDHYHHPRGHYRGRYGRGGFRGRGGYGRPFHNVNYTGDFHQNNNDVTVLTPGEPQMVVSGVEGAPTGPKAMRQGLPNTGRSGLKVAQQDSNGVAQSKEPSHQYSSNSHAGPNGSDKASAAPNSAKLEDGEQNNRQDSPDHTRRTYSREDSVDYGDDEDEIPEEQLAANNDRKDHRSRESSVDSYDRRSSRKERRHSRRHRRRSRSRSPASDYYEREEKYEDDYKSSSRRKSRSEKDKHRDRERSRDRKADRERDRDRHREKDRRRRRDRSASAEERSDEEHSSRHRSSHRSSRRDREKERERGRDRERDKDRGRERDQDRHYDEQGDRDRHHDDKTEESLAIRSSREETTGFRIHGSSRRTSTTNAPAIDTKMMPPPTAPRSFSVTSSKPPPSAPRGPASDRVRERERERERERDHDHDHDHDHDEAASVKSPTTSADPYQEERERRNRERMLKEQRRASMASSVSVSKKRSHDDFNEDKGFSPPTGPKADGGNHIYKRSRGSDGGPGSRRRSKYDDYDHEQENIEARASRTERERDSMRWS
jgi:zinc finger CCCH domain-containing protein 13